MLSRTGMCYSADDSEVTKESITDALERLNRIPLSVQLFVQAFECKRLGILRSTDINNFFKKRDLSKIYSPAPVPSSRNASVERAKMLHERVQFIKETYSPDLELHYLAETNFTGLSKKYSKTALQSQYGVLPGAADSAQSVAGVVQQVEGKGYGNVEYLGDDDHLDHLEPGSEVLMVSVVDHNHTPYHPRLTDTSKCRWRVNQSMMWNPF